MMKPTECLYDVETSGGYGDLIGLAATSISSWTLTRPRAAISFIGTSD